MNEEIESKNLQFFAIQNLREINLGKCWQPTMLQIDFTWFFMAEFYFHAVELWCLPSLIRLDILPSSIWEPLRSTYGGPLWPRGNLNPASLDKCSSSRWKTATQAKYSLMANGSFNVENDFFDIFKNIFRFSRKTEK